MKRALALAFLLLPSPGLACPRCFTVGPNHQGLVYATLFLLPIPLTLMALGTWWLRKELREDSTDERHDTP